MVIDLRHYKKDSSSACATVRASSTVIKESQEASEGIAAGPSHTLIMSILYCIFSSNMMRIIWIIFVD